jgi:alkylhydroperoxidase/carboxymuconolactone decarboxylase family protein YurZ
MSSHAAAARELFNEHRDVVDCVIENKETELLSAKMKALLNIAGKVQVSGKDVTQQDIDEAKRNGATDRDIHDTVLIAATFSMFNRYVDGLATLTPTDPKEYEPMGKRLATMGYVVPQNPNTNGTH